MSSAPTNKNGRVPVTPIPQASPAHAGRRFSAGSPSGSLRLIFPDRGPSVSEVESRNRVTAENRRAAEFTAAGGEDVRKLLALKVGEGLEGGRAAILPAARRRTLVKAGEHLGLRPFEANLIIAIVQDSARRGEAPASPSTQKMLEMIPQRQPGLWAREDTWMWVRISLAAAALAGLMTTFLVNWVTGAH